MQYHGFWLRASLAWNTCLESNRWAYVSNGNCLIKEILINATLWIENRFRHRLSRIFDGSRTGKLWFRLNLMSEILNSFIPCDFGDNVSWLTDSEPADWPIIVTCLLLPKWLFCWLIERYSQILISIFFCYGKPCNKENRNYKRLKHSMNNIWISKKI